MPHVFFKSVSDEDVQALSLDLVEDLALTMNTSADNFTFEKVESKFFQRGKSVSNDPFIEVHWFARSKEIQDAAALIITKKTQQVTKAKDIVVVFKVLKESDYYENGMHF